MLFKNFAFSILSFTFLLVSGPVVGATLSGTVKFDGQPTHECGVTIWDAAGQPVEWLGCDSEGNWWSRPDLPAGIHYVTAVGEHWGPVGELSDDIACPWEACTVTDGFAIDLSSGDVGGIAFDLEPEQRIYQLSGSILDPGGQPVGGMARLHNVLGWPMFEMWTAHEGRFWSEPLAAGTYYATTMHTGMLDEAEAD